MNLHNTLCDYYFYNFNMKLMEIILIQIDDTKFDIFIMWIMIFSEFLLDYLQLWSQLPVHFCKVCQDVSFYFKLLTTYWRFPVIYFIV